MPSPSAMPAETEFSGFVTCCDELTATISQVPLSRSACLETVGTSQPRRVGRRRVRAYLSSAERGFLLPAIT